MHGDERGGRDKKKEAGEVWRGPILRLIESSFGTAGTSLKNDGVFSRETRIRAACCSYSITRKREPGECICFIATTEQPSVSPKEAGHTFVIYDNCFLQKSVNILWWLFPGGGEQTPCSPDATFHQMGQRNCSGTMHLTPVKWTGRNMVSKQL